jgi:hypothetical protein
MRLRRQDDYENPAWPGLVDIFAFTLVLALIIWGSGKPGGDTGNGIRVTPPSIIDEVAKLERQHLEKFHKCFLNCVNPGEVDCNYDDQTREIKISFHDPIIFGTNKFDLTPDDQMRFKELAPKLQKCVSSGPYIILINGTADPRKIRETSKTPKNNTELSALRSATVSGLLDEAVSGIGKKPRVVGLGVKGKLIEPEPPDADEAYKEYRTVYLIIRVEFSAPAVMSGGGK